MMDKPTFAELKAAHEADSIDGLRETIETCGDGVVSGKKLLAALERESTLIALLESAIPYVKRHQGEPCPCCDVGYFVVADRRGEPEQEQCEFCYTVPYSEFNRQDLLKQLEGQHD